MLGLIVCCLLLYWKVTASLALHCLRRCLWGLAKDRRERKYYFIWVFCIVPSGEVVQLLDKQLGET